MAMIVGSGGAALHAGDEATMWAILGVAIAGAALVFVSGQIFENAARDERAEERAEQLLEVLESIDNRLARIEERQQDGDDGADQTP